MRKHGFTLAELMVAISISGLLTAVAVPKLSSSISKSKATELTPAAATYTKLQAAYLYEHKSFGTWKKIGYEAPGKRGKTDTFVYTRGEVISSIKTDNISKDLSAGKVSWQAENFVSLSGCKAGNQWKLKAIAISDTEIEFKPYIESKETSAECAPLSGDWAFFQSTISMDTPPSDMVVADASSNPSSPANNTGSNSSSSTNTGNNGNSGNNGNENTPSSSSNTQTANTFYDADENWTEEDDGSCGVMYTTGGNKCPPSWCKLNGNVSSNHGGWSKAGHKWNECYNARQDLIQEAADQGLLTCKNKNNCKVNKSGTNVTINGNVISQSSEEISTEAYNSSEEPAAKEICYTNSEAEAKAYFGYVDVLCAGQNTGKAGCSQWRRASECGNNSWKGKGYCSSWT
ncbi:prepilin-type N-terminal cleavage/methylation domain-containing protein [Fibrobacter sp. UWH5]|uniref:type II secretion system protein n=2 Tax=unclassified Fibrobacter TaxID=2634177 RepID=UPI0009158FC6|nr:prepilin-type N-terminal cleavage/methylation domain-containing protein [Fibrobacter sp. UWH5]SHK33908.1 prepilin-type N-terminal cleavage/methylation domain-containing protein [Fibrobacter sp. UWH5]